MERARVTRILSNIKKQQGDIAAATDILCELQVETFGSMSRREKTEFILEQVQLSIEKGDWTQAGILSRKISIRYFARNAQAAGSEIDKGKKAADEKAKKDKDEKSKKEAAAKLKEQQKVNDPSSAGVNASATLDGAPVEPENDDVTDLKLRYYEQQIIMSTLR